MDSIKYLYCVFNMLYYTLVHKLDFVDRLLGAEQSLYILSDEWAVM